MKRESSPTTADQRADIRHRANQEGTAIGGYHVLRLLDDIDELRGALEWYADPDNNFGSAHYHSRAQGALTSTPRGADDE